MKRLLAGLLFALVALSAQAQVTPNCSLTGVFYQGCAINGTTITATTKFVAPINTTGVYGFSGTTTGIGQEAGGDGITFANSGVVMGDFIGTAARFASGVVVGFVATNPPSANGADTGISRISPGVIGFGTGAPLSVGGTVQAANQSVFNASGNSSFAITNAGGSGANSVSITGVVSSGAAQTGYLCYNTTGSIVTYDSGATCLISREEYKTNVGPIDKALDTVMALRPFWGAYKEGTPMQDHHVQPFFGARYTATIDPRLTSFDKEGQPLGVRYENMTAVLAAAIQEQQREIAGLKRSYARKWRQQ